MVDLQCPKVRDRLPVIKNAFCIYLHYSVLSVTNGHDVRRSTVCQKDNHRPLTSYVYTDKDHSVPTILDIRLLLSCLLLFRVRPHHSLRLHKQMHSGGVVCGVVVLHQHFHTIKTCKIASSVLLYQLALWRFL
jgi:hypothetical protein